MKKRFDTKHFRHELSYRLENDKYIFEKLEFEDIEDNLDILKNRFKKLSKLYNALIWLISPVFGDKSIERFLDKYGNERSVIINIGTGNSKIADNVYNVDIFAYENVDIVCDITRLPFEDNSIDIILNIAVLEHVQEPQKVINEIHRVFKPQGIVYTAFPFIQGFHASPYDFTRVTQEGVKFLHKQFQEIEVSPFGGPTSGMLWILQEWIAILFSFGSKNLHIILYLMVMVLTAPLKFLDIVLIKHPMAKNIASGFIYIGRKQ